MLAPSFAGLESRTLLSGCPHAGHFIKTRPFTTACHTADSFLYFITTKYFLQVILQINQNTQGEKL